MPPSAADVFLAPVSSFLHLTGKCRPPAVVRFD
jgi:hypothetical protein